MLKKFYITFLLLGISIYAHAYIINNVDSLKQVLEEEKDSSKRLEPLLHLAFYYNNNCNDSVVPTSKELLQLATKYDEKFFIVQAHAFLAKNFKDNMHFDSARHHLYLGYLKSSSNSEERTNAWIAYFDFYESIGMSDSALYCIFKAHDEAKKTGNQKLVAGILHRIGNFYLTQKLYDKALSYCLRSYRIWKKIDPENTPGILSDIGNIYYYLKDYNNALKYYFKSYQISQDVQNYLGYAFTLNNIGLVYSKLEKHALALSYFEQSLHYYSKTNNKEGIANININLGKEYLLINEPDKALACALIALDLSKFLKLNGLILDSYKTLSDAYEAKGDYKMANFNRKMEVAYTDSFLNIEMVHKVANMQTKYEVSKKEAENHALKEKEASQALFIQKQKDIGIFIILALFIMIVITIMYYRVSKERKIRVKLLLNQNSIIENKNKEFERLNLEILSQKQKLEEINEFKNRLFSIVSHDARSPLNSLSGLISFLVEGEDIPHDAMISMLKDTANRIEHTSNFLDNLMSWAKSQLEGYNPVSHKISLKDEVEDVFNLYLYQIKSKEIRTVNSISSDLHVITDTNLLRLILRNLISNAIKFTPEKGDIIISSMVDEREIIVTVRDTGMGMTSDVEKKIFSGVGYTSLGTSNEKGSGIGLSLTKDFVNMLGGSIWVNSIPGQGSEFNFSLPISTLCNKEEISVVV